MSGIKSVEKKCHVENDKKKIVFFLRKMFVWIKEDRDSVTQPKSKNVEKNWKRKNWIRLEVCFFLSMSSNFVHTLILEDD